MNTAERIAALREVGFLSQLDDAALNELARSATERSYDPGKTMVSELEFGADVYVITAGHAEVSVCSQSGKRNLLGVLGVGDTFGEMASITGELRSATVNSLTQVDVLCIPDAKFDRLRRYRPQVVVQLLTTMGQRLVETERTLGSLMTAEHSELPETRRIPRNTLQLLWRELVINHKKELSFLALMAFALSLLIVRVVVHLCFVYAVAPREVLRAIYVSGFALVIVSAGAALLTYRPAFRRAIALVFGVGTAFIANELGVTLAFDIYYKDIFTADPTLVFDVERLYRRTEPHVAIVLGFILLFQAVYLKDFYHRVGHLARMRLRALVRGKSATQW